MNETALLPLLLITNGLWVTVWLVKYRRLKKLETDLGWAQEKARQKAAGIIEQAKNDALKLLQSVNMDSQKYKENLESSVKLLTANEIDEYKKVITNITKDVEKGVINDSQEFRKMFSQAWSQLQKQTEEQLISDVQEVRKKLADYEKTQKAEIKEKISRILEGAALELLGQSIDTQTDEKLVDQVIDKVLEKYAQRVA